MELDEIMKPPPGRQLRTPAQVEQGLRTLIMCGGSIKAASELLGVPSSTIISWKKDDPERYERIRKDMGPELEARAVADFQAFLLRVEKAKELALEKTVEGLETGTVKDPARTLQHLSISQGIAVQKILELTQRPTAVVEHRSVSEALARLRALGADIIDGDATVISSPQLPPAPDADNNTKE